MLALEGLTGQKKKREVTAASCTLFYQTEECRNQLEEAMKYEGMEVPFCHPCTDSNITDVITGVESPLVLVEIKEDLVNLARLLHPLISHQTRVVLIGRENTITSLRTVEHLGFYYLYWPAEKTDVAAFLHELQEDLQQGKGPQSSRLAKRVAVVGPKGGSGCTMITCELAHGLVKETQQQVILVDHGYTGSAMHIMLGKRDLERMPISEQAQRHHTLGNILDHVGAQSQLSQVDKKISYLGFEIENGGGDELREYTNNVLEPLRNDANFILEDYSASVKFYPQPKWLCLLMDCVIIVVQPTLSSVFETRQFLEVFNRVNEVLSNPARSILVLNHCNPKDSVEKESIEQYLQRPVDIHIPYFKQCEEFLTSGQRFVSSKTPLTRPFINLARLVVGKPVVNGGVFSFFRRKGKSNIKDKNIRNKTEPTADV
ncbi:ParA family protein [Sansalvadorimonas sp. 2012CJ34-2]|uniref:ParA family protein n=1 Tax=Parendozoicomonas callyspongiae TaxID=2942213 RepID=A0ABT0PB25_9GAMM|nr:ParA family protein [Sansalvadorimonas sp. 2012CJ34-2]MCL6268525.1 ParA family protein [Sansalvadorimonas sp. 2012CJ34-2]